MLHPHRESKLSSYRLIPSHHISPRLTATYPPPPPHIPCFWLPRRTISAPLGGGYIPNTFCRPLGPSHGKMFCGRFSTSGDVLLTASQDSIINLYDSESVYQWSSKPGGVSVGWVIYVVARAGKHDPPHVLVGKESSLSRPCADFRGGCAPFCVACGVP